MSCKECKVSMYCPDAHTEKSHLCGKALEQEPCEDWYDVPSNEMILERARQASKDLRKRFKEDLEQEPLLDKIRAEIIEDIEKYNDIYDDTCHGLRMALDVIDKYTKGIT